MIDCDTMRILELISNKSNWGDEEMKEDIEALKEALQQDIVVLRYILLLFI